MNAEEFLRVLNANRDLLDTRTEEEQLRNPSKLCGCPAWVVIEKTCSPSLRDLANRLGDIPDNPTVSGAVAALMIDYHFIDGVVTGWDHAGLIYDDAPTDEDWRLRMSGFLVSLPLSPNYEKRLLTEGT